jgi:sugar phosphate isomerase/epimerase
MRIGCIPICFLSDLSAGRMAFADWLAMASRCRLDGIEIYDGYLRDWSPAGLEAMATAVRESGLAASMFTGYGDFGRSGEAAVEEVKRNVEAAVVFGAGIVRIVGGRWPEGVARDDALCAVAEGVKRCLDHAQAHGVTLALENHPAIGTGIADFLRILDLVDDARLGVNLDTSNCMCAGESAVDLVRHTAGRVVHVHASDRSADLEHQVVGEGVVDFPTIFRALRAVGFDGWLSLEAGGEKGEAGIAQGRAFVLETWAACAA